MKPNIQSTDNKGRYIGQYNPHFRFTGKKICTHCEKHVVLAGASECPTCQRPLLSVQEVPRRHSAEWRYWRGRLARNSSKLTYMTATPRRIPGRIN